jgi:nucleotidyltransferase substrate binding protein (TIGR01987 family)
MTRMTRKQAAEQVLSECFWGDYVLDADTMLERLDQQDHAFERHLFSKIIENARFPSKLIRALFDEATISRLLDETATAHGRNNKRYRLVRANLTGEYELVPEYGWGRTAALEPGSSGSAVKNDARLRRRYESLSKAFSLLAEAAETQKLSRLAQEGMVRRFEYTFELAWKTIRDYLQAKGSLTTYPRDVLKEASQTGLVRDGEAWLDMLESSDTFAHTYDDACLAEAVTSIRQRFFPSIRELVEGLRAEAT